MSTIYKGQGYTVRRKPHVLVAYVCKDEDDEHLRKSDLELRRVESSKVAPSDVEKGYWLIYHDDHVQVMPPDAFDADYELIGDEVTREQETIWRLFEELWKRDVERQDGHDSKKWKTLRGEILNQVKVAGEARIEHREWKGRALDLEDRVREMSIEVAELNRSLATETDRAKTLATQINIVREQGREDVYEMMRKFGKQQKIPALLQLVDDVKRLIEADIVREDEKEEEDDDAGGNEDRYQYDDYDDNEVGGEDDEP